MKFEPPRGCKHSDEQSHLQLVSVSGARCDNGRYFLLTVVKYMARALLVGSDFDTF